MRRKFAHRREPAVLESIVAQNSQYTNRMPFTTLHNGLLARRLLARSLSQCYELAPATLSQFLM